MAFRRFRDTRKVGAFRLSPDKLYQALLVAAVAVGFLAGEVEVHGRLWAQVAVASAPAAGVSAPVAGAPHDFATACRRHKDRPWVGAKATTAPRRPVAAVKPTKSNAPRKAVSNVSGNVPVNASGNASSREHQHGGTTARGVERRPASDGD